MTGFPYGNISKRNENIKFLLIFTHLHDIFQKILFFLQKRLSGLPYLRMPPSEFHDMYLILRDFPCLLKCNQCFAWKQSLHLPAFCVQYSGSSPGWWATSLATYCPGRMVEDPKSKSTQPRYSTTRVTLYYYCYSCQWTETAPTSPTRRLCSRRRRPSAPC